MYEFPRWLFPHNPLQIRILIKKLSFEQHQFIFNKSIYQSGIVI